MFFAHFAVKVLKAFNRRDRREIRKKEDSAVQRLGSFSVRVIRVNPWPRS